MDNVKDNPTGHAAKDTWTPALTMPLTVENIDTAFAYRLSDLTPGGQHVRTALVTAAKAILTNVPPSTDQIVAIQGLQEVWRECTSVPTIGAHL